MEAGSGSTGYLSSIPYSNREPTATPEAQTRVGGGDFLFVPGGTEHWSGGDRRDGALFYEEGVGKFDLNPVK